MTDLNKQKVLAKYPDAVCDLSEWSGIYHIWIKQLGLAIEYKIVGAGDTDRLAWADASRRLDQPSP